MAEIEDSDVWIASRLAEGLFVEGEVEEYLDATTVARERVGIVVSDVEEDIEDFKRDIDFAQRLDLSVPALHIRDSDEPIVVALSTFLSDRWSGTQLPILEEFDPTYLRARVTEAIESSGMELEPLDVRSAIDIVRRGVIEHLTIRAAAFREFVSREWLAGALLRLRQSRSSPVVATPGANFFVASASAGLRVHWSGAYRISPNYFGAPTSPVNGVLQAGRYTFGVDGGAYGSNIQWDGNAIVTLPGANSVHLQF
jgi:hypothetical protein